LTDLLGKPHFTKLLTFHPNRSSAGKLGESVATQHDSKRPIPPASNA
jgi:hypothetical protein